MSDWSTLADDVKARRVRPGPVCAVKRMLDGLAEDDRKIVEDALAKTQSFSTTGLAKVFRDRLGSEAPSVFTIGNHRRQQCGCSR